MSPRRSQLDEPESALESGTVEARATARTRSVRFAAAPLAVAVAADAPPVPVPVLALLTAVAAPPTLALPTLAQPSPPALSPPALVPLTLLLPTLPALPALALALALPSLQVSSSMLSSEGLLMLTPPLLLVEQQAGPCERSCSGPNAASMETLIGLISDPMKATVSATRATASAVSAWARWREWPSRARSPSRHRRMHRRTRPEGAW